MVSIAEINEKNQVEAVLFAAGRAVDAEEMSRLTRLPADQIKKIARELKQDLEERNSPILLLEEANGWKFTVGEKYLEMVKNITPHTELDRAMLETLAVIAWKQPMLQSKLIKIRTSSAYEHIKQLVEMGFISKVKKGRSFLLKPTGTFFDYFDLPSKEAVKEVFKDIDAMETEMQQKIAEEKEKKDAEKGDKEEEKVGDLETFDVPEGEDNKKKELGHEAEHFGEMDVYDVKKTKKHKESEEKEEEKEEELVEGVDLAEKILEEDKKEEEPKEVEEEKRLPEELEEFAGEEEKLGEEE